ncbi:MAG: hypothetical protein AAFX78_07910 [Cyanobacteria bacterium J06638_20]
MQNLSPMQDNEELLQLFQADQLEHNDTDDQIVDLSTVSAKDVDRLARVKQLYQEGKIRTGADYFYAALILQHSNNSIEDYLLAHEFCVISIIKGHVPARWLAAATEDRFLISRGQPQRFGTQYRVDEEGGWQLYEVDPDVTDGLRQSMDVPPLEEARSRETSPRWRPRFGADDRFFFN